MLYYRKQSYEVERSTTLTGTVETKIGNIVVASITVRDTYSLSDGWTKLYDSGVFDSSVGKGQRMIVAWQRSQTAEAAKITVTQSSSQRIYINLISVENDEDPVLSSEMSKVHEAGHTFSVPDKKVGEPIIWAMSCAYWGTTSPYDLWTTSPNDIFSEQLGAYAQSRQGNFTADTLTGKNIHFTEPPAEGAVITADYTTPVIPKDDQHVFDLTVTLTFNEHIPVEEE